jgi:hypothetical protein
LHILFFYLCLICGGNLCRTGPAMDDTVYNLPSKFCRAFFVKIAFRHRLVSPAAYFDLLAGQK